MSQVKSPRAPSRSLEVALADARRIYSNYNHAKVSRAEIAAAWGLTSSTSGPFSGRIYSLLAFGLIEGRSEFEVSSDFRILVSEPNGSATWREAAMRCVSRPAVFSSLRATFSDHLPPVASLASRLEHSMHFIPSKAAVVAQVYVASVAFATGGVDEAVDTTDFDLFREDTPVAQSAEEPRPQPAERHAEGRLAASPDQLDMAIPLGGTRVARLSFPIDITADDVRRISAVLGAAVQ